MISAKRKQHPLLLSSKVKVDGGHRRGPKIGKNPIKFPN
jgi:hypothetical protein